MLPEKEDIIWDKIVLGEITLKIKSFGAKLFMNKILFSIKNDPSSNNLNNCKIELYEYFNKNKYSVQFELNEMKESI